MTVKLIPLLELPRELQMETRHWRNSEKVARYFKIKYIDEATHINWLNIQAQPLPRIVAYIICVDEQHSGVVYFHSIDREKGIADWGIYIHLPQLRGKGVGKTVLTKSISMAREQLGLHTLYLDVKKDNMSAVRLYEDCGFVYLYDEEDGFARYSCNLGK